MYTKLNGVEFAEGDYFFNEDSYTLYYFHNGEWVETNHGNYHNSINKIKRENLNIILEKNKN